MAARLPRSEAIALGLGAFLTGTDTYGAKVRIANTGTVPIRVYPENLVVHFGAETAVVSTINHPRFLQRVVLEPGFEVEGLVTYEARIDLGAAMRLGAGSFSYVDDTVVVTYGR